MGRKRKTWDSEYKDMLARKVPGMSANYRNNDQNGRRRNSTQEDFSEVKEWRYLMSPRWIPKEVDLTTNSHIHKNEHEIDWDYVERVIIDHDISDTDRCPICLHGPPVAPRLTKCGHVFCLLCLCKYRSLYGSSCPLCQSPLYVFKPLLYSKVPTNPVEVGQRVDLDLVARSLHGSAIVKWDRGSSREVPWMDDQGLISGPQIRSTGQNLLDMYNRELEQLNEMHEVEDEEHYERAKQEIEQDMKRHCERSSADRLVEEQPQPFSIDEEHNMVGTAASNGAARSGAVSNVTTHSGGLPNENTNTANDGSTKGILEQNIPKEQTGDEEARIQNTLYYYFYQPQGRFRTFLDPLDVKMLINQFQQYTKFPAAISAVVKNIDYLVVDKKLQARCRYLDYLPLGTAIRMISCDWSGVLSDEVVQRFQQDITVKHAPKSPTKSNPMPFHPELNDTVPGVDYEEDTSYDHDYYYDGDDYGLDEEEERFSMEPEFVISKRNGRRVIKMNSHRI